MLIEAHHPYVVDPVDPRAPDDATWALLTAEERRSIVASLEQAEEAIVRCGSLEALARTEALEGKLAEAERSREAAEREREAAERERDTANQRIAALEAELARRGG